MPPRKRAILLNTFKEEAYILGTNLCMPAKSLADWSARVRMLAMHCNFA